jgi:phosphoribosylaminoimidazole-succinocarboxamide synthase
MPMNCLVNVATPQLEKLHTGKVRESFRIDANTRLIVVTDRISAFDRVLGTPVPKKGAVLNSLSAHWFEATRDIVPNHLVRVVDPQAMLVREAVPIRIEMVVRGYMTGSMWRGYEQGKRTFSGVTVPDGLTKGEKLAAPIVTPTTKEESDTEITPERVVRGGWAEREQFACMSRASLALFARGTDLLAKRGILLVDTKYEFGVIDGELALIDEIHTPDSSRFWSVEDHARDPVTCADLDKEYVRRWLMDHAVDGNIPSRLPDDIVAETSRRYASLFESVTGSPLALPPGDPRGRLYASLVHADLIRDGYVAIFMGSSVDLPHCQKLKETIQRFGVAVDLRVVSAHKNGEDIARIAEEYNLAVEPGVAIAVAGLSNGLGGALAANLGLPVINCPPFKDQTDFLMNINSSLAMPSKVAAATVVGADAAALAALRSLNLYRLRDRFVEEIVEVKARLRDDDRRIRQLRTP